MKVGIFIGRGLTPRDYNPALRDDDTTLPMSYAFGKANEGAVFYYSPDEAAELAQMYQRQGIGFVPWGIGRGATVSAADTEGHEAGQLAAAVEGCYMLDLEPYPAQYWAGVPGAATAFCNSYKAAVEAAGKRPVLWLTVDARNPGINLDEWRAFEDVLDIRYWPQAYGPEFYPATYPDFSVMLHGLLDACNPLLNAGIEKSRIWPVLSTYSVRAGMNGQSEYVGPLDGDVLTKAIQQVHDFAFPGVALFRRGTLSNELADAINAMPDPWASTQEPPQEPPPSEPTLQQLAQRLNSDLTGMQNDIAARLNNIRDTAAAIVQRAANQGVN